MKHLYLLLFIFAMANLYSEKVESSEDEFEYDQIYDYYKKDCLEFKGYERWGAGAILHFRNKCPVIISGIVCIEYKDGTRETRHTPKPLYKYGFWDVKLYSKGIPKNIHWSSAPFDPEIPEPCAGPNK